MKDLTEMPSNVIALQAEFKSQVSSNEARFLYNAVLRSPAGDVVEIGSALGGTTIVLIEAAKIAGKHVWSIDPYPTELEGVAADYESGLISGFREGFAKNILNGKYPNVCQIQQYLPECIDDISPYVSVAFVDGLHELKSALCDFYLIYSRVVRGGWICTHDINFTKGQLSKTEDTGLWRMLNLIPIDKLFTAFQTVDSMFCGRK